MEARANNVIGEGLCISGLAGDARDAHSVNCIVPGQVFFVRSIR